MKFVLEKCKEVANALKLITKLVSEGNLVIKEDGWHVYALSQGSSVYFNYFIDRQSFAEYAESEKELRCDLMQLMKVFKRIGKDDVAEITIEDDIVVSSTGKKNFTVKIPLLSDEGQTIGHKEIPRDWEQSFGVDDLSEALGDVVSSLKEKPNTVDLSIVNNTLHISGAYNKTNKATSSCESFVGSSTEIVETAQYNVFYLETLLSGSDIINTVSLFFKKDAPIQIIYKHPTIQSLACFIAPLVKV